MPKLPQPQLAGADDLVGLDPVFAQMAVTVGRNLWGLPHLTMREKAIVCLTADLCHPHLGLPMAMHVKMALDNGVQPRMIRELLRHLGPYVAYPILVPAFAQLAELGVPVEDDPAPPGHAPLSPQLDAFASMLPAAGLAAFTREQLAQRWARSGLSARERAISCLVVDILYQTLGDSFRLHLDLAVAAGADRAVLEDLLQGVAEFGLARAWNAARAIAHHLAWSP
jgi:alkylhydroperoxidase/carboxymuconolactone decarboxylase family protein YurZ